MIGVVRIRGQMPGSREGANHVSVAASPWMCTQ